MRTEVPLHHHRLDQDHRPVPVVRGTAALVNHPHAGFAPRARGEHRHANGRSNRAIERLIESTGIALRFLVTPHVEAPIVDAQSSGVATRELWAGIACPDVTVRQLEEVHVV
jgi:hypothetical protein